MKPLFLAVLLSVVQAAPPVPRQAADNPAGCSKAVQKDARSKQEPTSTLPVHDAASSPTNEQTGKTPTKTDALETVPIRESAAMPHLDSWDKAYVILTGLLVMWAPRALFSLSKLSKS